MIEKYDINKFVIILIRMIYHGKPYISNQKKLSWKNLKKNIM